MPELGLSLVAITDAGRLYTTGSKDYYLPLGLASESLYEGEAEVSSSGRRLTWPTGLTVELENDRSPVCRLVRSPGHDDLPTQVLSSGLPSIGWAVDSAGALTRASNDAEAVGEYLAEYGTSPAQIGNIERDLRKLAWWMRLRGFDALSNLMTADIADFRRWLQSPDQDSIGPRCKFKLGNGAVNPDWRPLSGGLKDSSVQTTLAGVRGLFNYLCGVRYLMANPVTPLKVQNTSTKTVGADYNLGAALVRYSLVTLELHRSKYPAMAKKISYYQWLLTFLIATGFRVSAVAGAQYGDIANHRGRGLELRVVTKANKEVLIPWHENMEGMFKRYAEATEMNYNDQSLLVSGWQRAESSTTRQTLGRHVKELFEIVYRYALTDNRLPPYALSQLEKASIHWLRHTSASISVNELSHDIALISHKLGHASVAITQDIYVHQQARTDELSDLIVELINYVSTDDTA